MNRKLIIVALFSAFLILNSKFLTPVSAQTGSCSSGTPARASGLVTTKDLSGKFTTSTGTCIVDEKTTFVPFKIPTYDDLKSTFFDQSKNPRKTTINGSANQGDLTSNLSPSDPDRLFFIDGNLTINGNVFPGRSVPVVVFVKGNLTVSSNITYGSSSNTTGLVFVVGGDTIIDSSVSEINSVIISPGVIYTAGNSCSPSSVNTSNALTIKGSLIALNTNNWIHFCRSLSNNSNPAESIQVQPKYLVIFKDIFSETLQKWSEVTADTDIIEGGFTAFPTPTPGGSQNGFPDNGLVAYWKMEESSGTRYDSFGSNNLTPIGSVSQATGKIGSAGKFTPAQKLNINDNPSLSTNGSDFTISAWVYLDSKSSVGGIIGRFDNAGANREYRLYYRGADSVDRFEFVVYNGATDATLVRSNKFGSPSLGTWYFITVYSRNGKEIGISVNNGPFDTADTSINVPDTGASTVIGSTSYDSSENYWDGRIDEVGIWGRKLSDQDISALYNSGNGLTYVPAGSADNTPTPPSPTCTAYADNDGDGYGAGAAQAVSCPGGQLPAGFVSNASDCYDNNANARPNQTGWFTSSRGDGSFDYNCNGTVEQTYTRVDSSCGADGPQGVCALASCGGQISWCDWRSGAGAYGCQADPDRIQQCH